MITTETSLLPNHLQLANLDIFIPKTDIEHSTTRLAREALNLDFPPHKPQEAYEIDELLRECIPLQDSDLNDEELLDVIAQGYTPFREAGYQPYVPPQYEPYVDAPALRCADVVSVEKPLHSSLPKQMLLQLFALAVLYCFAMSVIIAK